MSSRLPGAVPEIPVTDINAAMAYYEDTLGFTVDWGGAELGLAGISKDHCRMFLANEAYRKGYRNGGPTLNWLNLNSTSEVDETYRSWSAGHAVLISRPESKPWGLHEFIAADLDGNLLRVFYDFATPTRAQDAAPSERAGDVMNDRDSRRIRLIVERRMASFEAAERALDASALIGHFSTAGDFYMHNDGQRLAADAVAAAVQQGFPALRSLEGGFTGLEVHVLGADTAFATATFHETITTNDGAVVRQRGAASWLWRCYDGEWRIAYGHVDHQPDPAPGNAEP